jgi:HAD superfamily hydrolase (TIGR01549 family)
VGAFDGVLFDFGHTLFNNKPAGTVIDEFYRARRERVDLGAFASLWDAIRAASRQPAELAKGRDLNPSAHRECWLALLAPLDELAPGLAEFTYELESSQRGWEPYPDARDVLLELQRRQIPVGIVSDCGWDIREVFRAYAFDELVASFDLSYEHEACKPAPVMFLAACAQIGVEPGRALMVGDSPLTDGGASAVGIVTLILPAGDRSAAPALHHVLDLAC